MDGWIWPDHDYAWLAFFVLGVLGAAAAVSTGRAFARSWSPQWQIVPAMIALAAAVQWLHFALFRRICFRCTINLVTIVILLAAAFLGYQSMRARQMSTQYSWRSKNLG